MGGAADGAEDAETTTGGATTGDNTTAEAAPVARRGWFRRYRVRALLVGALILGVFVGGAGTGWWAADRFSPRTSPDVTITAAPAADGPAESATMPDVRGLTTSDARQVLADVGFAQVTVAVRERPWVGTPGNVVAQEPPGGQPVPAEITLFVAAPAVVPEVVGGDVTEATRALQSLGADVVVNRVYRAGKPSDEVIQVSPAAGSPVPAKVVLTATTPPAELALTELRPVQSRCRTDSDVPVNGTVVTAAVTCRPRGGDFVGASYLLGRRTAQLTAVLGQADTAEPGSTVLLEIVGDGKVLASVKVPYANSQQVTVATAGVVRLELRAKLTPAPAACCPDTSAVFGDVALVGGAAELAYVRELNK